MKDLRVSQGSVPYFLTYPHRRNGVRYEPVVKFCRSELRKAKLRRGYARLPVPTPFGFLRNPGWPGLFDVGVPNATFRRFSSLPESAPAFFIRGSHSPGVDKK